MNDTVLPTCFVIQSFDGAKYDRRYTETIRPALIKAGVLPQRADEILGLNPIVEKIEKAIAAAAVCVAEVSEDNPNVWLELGYALALNRPTVILCDRSIRAKLPFDIQHRPVIYYRSDSRSGYDELERDIVRSVQNQLQTSHRSIKTYTLKPGSESSSDLMNFEVAVLTSVFATWPTSVGSISLWDIEKGLAAEGYTTVGIALGLTKLIGRDYLLERIVIEEGDWNNGPTEVKHYQISPSGINWIESNSELLQLKVEPQAVSVKKPLHIRSFDDLDDDVPF